MHLLLNDGGLSLVVKRPGREADHSHPASAEIKKTWIDASTPPHIFSWRSARIDEHRRSLPFTVFFIGMCAMEVSIILDIPDRIGCFRTHFFRKLIGRKHAHEIFYLSILLHLYSFYTQSVQSAMQLFSLFLLLLTTCFDRKWPSSGVLTTLKLVALYKMFTYSHSV
jgi:hypothetical protein